MWQTTLIAQECAIASPVILTASTAPAACQVTKLILPLLNKNNVDNLYSRGANKMGKEDLVPLGENGLIKPKKTSCTS